MQTVADDFWAVMNIKPEPGETFLAFAERLTKKVNAAPDSTWENLSQGAQEWHNEALVKIAERKALIREGKAKAAEAIDLPELDGFEEVPPAKQPIPRARPVEDEPAEPRRMSRRKTEKPTEAPPKPKAAAPAPQKHKGNGKFPAQLTPLVELHTAIGAVLDSFGTYGDAPAETAVPAADQRGKHTGNKFAAGHKVSGKHKAAIGQGVKAYWDEVRAGKRPHPRAANKQKRRAEASE